MFCKNCGKQLVDSAKFCDGCGAQLEVTVTQTVAVQKPKKNGKKIGGIVMVVLGGLSILGSFSNDYYWNIAHNGMNMSDFITVGIQIGLVVVGAFLIFKSKK